MFMSVFKTLTTTISGCKYLLYEIYQNLKLVEKICAQQNAQNLKLRYERELAKCKGRPEKSKGAL